MTAKDSADGVLRNLTAAYATAAWKNANVVLGGCGLTYAGADLQVFGNLGDGTGPLYALNSGSVTNGFCKRWSRDHAKLRLARRQRKSNQKTRPSNQPSDQSTSQGCQINGIKSCIRSRYRKAQARV